MARSRVLSAATMGAEPEPLPLESTRVQRLVFEEVRTAAGAAAEEAGLDRAERLGARSTTLTATGRPP